MNRTAYKEAHRVARMGALGSLAFTLPRDLFPWFRDEVYDIRWPHIGDSRHNVPYTFDSLVVSTARRLQIRRQFEYQSHIRFCSRCHGYHHDRRDCL